MKVAKEAQEGGTGRSRVQPNEIRNPRRKSVTGDDRFCQQYPCFLSPELQDEPGENTT